MKIFNVNDFFPSYEGIPSLLFPDYSCERFRIQTHHPAVDESFRKSNRCSLFCLIGLPHRRLDAPALTAAMTNFRLAGTAQPKDESLLRTRRAGPRIFC